MARSYRLCLSETIYLAVKQRINAEIKPENPIFVRSVFMEDYVSDIGILFSIVMVMVYVMWDKLFSD